MQRQYEDPGVKSGRPGARARLPTDGHVPACPPAQERARRDDMGAGEAVNAAAQARQTAQQNLEKLRGLDDATKELETKAVRFF